MDNEEEDVFEGFGVKVSLPTDKSFTLIMETLTRIGYPSKTENTLFQSCHIFHKRGQYAIMHFKEMFYFDGKEPQLSDTDIVRRDSIAKLLEQWNMLAIEDEIDTEFSLKEILVVPHRDKGKWKLVPKYDVGVRRARRP